MTDARDVNQASAQRIEMTRSSAMTPAIRTIQVRGMSCPECNTPLNSPLTGWAAIDAIPVLCDACATKHREETKQGDRARAIRVRVARLKQLGDLSEATASASFGESDAAIEGTNPEAWAAGRVWTPDAGNLYLWGRPGTGKSYLGRCLLHQMIQSGHDVAEVTARRVEKVAARFDEGAGTWLRWTQARLLLLDDIDKPKWNSGALAALWELLDTRASANLRTIVTANVGPREILAMLHEANVANESVADATLNRLRPLQVFKMVGGSNR